MVERMDDDVKIYEPVRIKGKEIKMKGFEQQTIEHINTFEEVIRNKDKEGFDAAFNAVFDDFMFIRDKETRHMLGERLINTMMDALAEEEE